jgi:hypothetical protein
MESDSVGESKAQVQSEIGRLQRQQIGIQMVIGELGNSKCLGQTSGCNSARRRKWPMPRFKGQNSRHGPKDTYFVQEK